MAIYLTSLLDTLDDLGFDMMLDDLDSRGRWYRTKHDAKLFTTFMAYPGVVNRFIVYIPKYSGTHYQHDDVIDIYSKFMRMSKL